MRLLAIVHMYPPIHNAGGETTIHAAFRAMVDRGHEVTVICRPHSEEIHFPNYEHEGVIVVRPPRVREEGYNPEIGEQEWFRNYVKEYNPDLLLTHLDLTTMAMQLSIDTRKPLAHFFHNTFSIPVFHVSPNKCQLAIFNSKWVSEESKWKGPQVIIHPVVEPERYRCERGTKITLVNPTPGKGADTFYSVSKLLPDYDFLTVKSVYGEQIAVPNISAHLHPNVETMEHTADIREVFRKTKILLMPSDYESYGRVAVEGACAGIPTIAHPTEGLLEALGADCPDWLSEFVQTRKDDFKNRCITPTPEGLKGGYLSGAGIFCDRNDTESWKVQIERLMTDEVYYRKQSDLALELANKLDPKSEFDRLEKAMLITSQRSVKVEKMWTVDRRVYKRADGTITDDKSQAQSFYRAIGQLMPLEEAVSAGFVSDSLPIEVTMNTADLDPESRAKYIEEQKMVAEAAENKSEQPSENKTLKRKKKVA